MPLYCRHAAVAVGLLLQRNSAVGTVTGVHILTPYLLDKLKSLGQLVERENTYYILPQQIGFDR